MIDIILIAIIAGFTILGWKSGLVHTLGSLLGTVLGIYLASRYYETFSVYLIKWTGWDGNFSRVLMFMAAFVIINRLVGLAFWLLDRSFGIVTRLPFVHSIDSFLGLVFGLLEGLIVIGIAVYFINKFPIKPEMIKQLAESRVAVYCLKFSAFLWPLMPDQFLSIMDQFTKFSFPGLKDFSWPKDLASTSTSK